MVNALIIDDEALARQRVRRLLEPYTADIAVTGECRSGAEAVAAIRRERPDLIFLDIQMKDMTGFEVLEELRHEPLPMVIFVTAYDQYALRAFDVFAFDYLLKPIQEERFRRSLTKALAALRRPGGRDAAGQLRAILQYLHLQERPEPQPLTIRLAGRVRFLDPSQVQYIEASGYYIELFTTTEKFLIRESLASIGERLDPAIFLRIHRSTIINRAFLREVAQLGNGDIEVCMRDSRRFRVSRSHKEELLGQLGL